MKVTPRDYRAERDRREPVDLRAELQHVCDGLTCRCCEPAPERRPAVKVADHVRIRRRTA